MKIYTFSKTSVESLNIFVIFNAFERGNHCFPTFKMAGNLDKQTRFESNCPFTYILTAQPTILKRPFFIHLFFLIHVHRKIESEFNNINNKRAILHFTSERVPHVTTDDKQDIEDVTVTMTLFTIVLLVLCVMNPTPSCSHQLLDWLRSGNKYWATKHGVFDFCESHRQMHK